MYCVLKITLFHYQESALHKAAQNDHQEVAELLLSFKASIDDKNEVFACLLKKHAFQLFSTYTEHIGW